MANVIDQDLKTFKEQVSPTIDKMSSSCQDLADKVLTVTNATTACQSAISSSYNSSNKSTILSKFDQINDYYKSISSSIDSDLKPIITDSKKIVDLVTELETIITDIEAQESIISSENSKEKPDSSTISSARDKINTLNNDFKTKHEEAKNLLTALKAKDAALAEELAKAPTDYTSLLGQLKFGSYEQKSFKASNGMVINYYLYLPDYGTGEVVEGLPVHVYLHGSGERGSGVNRCGLPKMLNEQTIVPEGIVICPQCPDGGDFSKMQQAIVELTNSVVNDYKADSNKVSLSGHSMGAIAGYKIVGNNPDTFAAFLPISGLSYNGEQIKDSKTKIWIFHGKNDTSCEYSNAVKVYNYLKSCGKDIQMYTYEKEGHPHVQNYTFEREFTDENGETINPLTWAFRQSLTEA